MIYIWLDESDKKGSYFSNFYGGILINSKYYDTIISECEALIKNLGITEEIKWQRVNAYNYDNYKEIVDYIFSLLDKGYAKIRIFFTCNQYQALGLSERHVRDEFTILYYEFIKHAFGLIHCDYPEEERSVRLYIDDIPARGAQVAQFKEFLFRLNNDPGFRNAKILIRENDILEIDSAKHIPLQLLDLILGAICYKLNDKHLVKNPETGRRGKRTILKEKLYKYIYSKISELRPNFNIGVSTGVTNLSDRWTHPYRHWCFKPSNHTRDLSQSKP